MMKACVLHEINGLKFQDYPIPEIKSGEVLLKVKACGICGSDIPRIFKNGTYHFPTIPGHEFAGEVVKVGDEKDKNLLGLHAAVFPLIPCKQCSSCKKEIYETCKSYDYLGSRSDGAYAEFVRVPVWNLVPIPQTLSFEEAAMSEPAAVALHALNKVKENMGETVAIFGTGTIGIIIAQWVRSFGAKKILLIGTDNKNRELLKKLGFNNFFSVFQGDPVKWVMEQTNGEGADVTIEVAGVQETVANCLESASLGGKVIFVGNPGGDFVFPQKIYWQILRKQLSIYGTWNSSYNDTDKNDWTIAIDAMNSGKIDVKPLITHKFPLKSMNEGLEIMRDKKEFYKKIMVVFN